MLATFVQYSFLVFVAAANLSFGFGIACYLGWGPAGFLEITSLQDPDEPACDAGDIGSRAASQAFPELLQELVAALDARLVSLQGLGDVLRHGEQTALVIEAASADLNGQMQQTLQRIGAAASQLRQPGAGSSAAKRHRVAEELDRRWANMNDALIQLVMLGFEDEELDKTVATVSAAQQAIIADLRLARGELQGLLASLDPEDCS